MRTHPLFRAGALASVCFLFGPAMAATELAPIEVSATRLEPSAELLPVGAVVLDRDDINDVAGNSLADVLDTVAGINGRRFYGINGSRTSVDMLGFGVTGTQNSLILINGRRLNDVDLAPIDFAAIPVSAIERIEVLPASGAVLYGNGAVGGAINIVTREQYDGGTAIEGRFGTYSTSGGRLETSYRGPSSSAMIAAQTLESDGYRDNNETGQHNLFADFRHRGTNADSGITVLADKQRLRLPGARTVNPNTGLDEISDGPVGTSTPRDWADQQGVQVMPSTHRRLGQDLSFQLDGTARLKQQEYFVDQGFGFTSYTEARSVSAALNPRLHGLATHGGISHQWSLGIDYSYTNFDRDTSLNELSAGQPIHEVAISQHTSAVYLLDTMALTQNTLVTLGARHEWVATRARDSYDANAPAPACFFPPCDAQGTPFDTDQDMGIYSIGIRHWLLPELALFANLERNARYATVDEFFELDPANNFVTSLDPLDIQTGRLASAGADWQRGRSRLTVTGWSGHFSNEIAYDPDAGENVNLDDTRRYGVSINARARVLPALTLTANGSYQRARFDDGINAGNEVPVVPRQTGYLRADWAVAERLTVSLSQRYVGKKYFDNDQANDFGQRIPSYRWTDLELHAQARDSSLWAKLGVYNLQDREGLFDYGVSSSFTPGVYNGYPLPDKHLMLTLGARL